MRGSVRKKHAVPRQPCAELILLAPMCVTRMVHAHNILLYII